MGKCLHVSAQKPQAFRGRSRAGLSRSQRDIAYQPRATLWDTCPAPSRVLKERRLSPNVTRMHDPPGCGVPSERMNGFASKPRALPWAGMRRPFRANQNVQTRENLNGISHQSPRLHAVGLAKAGYLGSSHPTTPTPTGLHTAPHPPPPTMGKSTPTTSTTRFSAMRLPGGHLHCAPGHDHFVGCKSNDGKP
jgi:hypothetical protein